MICLSCHLSGTSWNGLEWHKRLGTPLNDRLVGPCRLQMRRCSAFDGHWSATYWEQCECDIIYSYIYSIGKEQKILTQGANNLNADIKFFRLQTIFELRWEQIWARRRLANVSAFTCWSIWCRKTWGSNEPAQRVSTAVAAKSWRAQEAFWQILVWLKLMIMGRTLLDLQLQMSFLSV